MLSSFVILPRPYLEKQYWRFPAGCHLVFSPLQSAVTSLLVSAGSRDARSSLQGGELLGAADQAAGAKDRGSAEQGGV